jgi:hypothetical protein
MAVERYEPTAPLPLPPTITHRAAPETPPFVLREFGHGMLVAIAGNGPLGNREECIWLLNSLGADRYDWVHRYGLTRIGPNDDFWNFLIPDVGLAPVTEFCILITVFVILIGPVNYWLMRRWKRIHLLVITIPVSAGLVTAALFLYALIADGLGTRVRARSVTCIDQRNKQAACFARLSYYAGLTPSGGLVFPVDTLVLPLEEFPTRTQQYSRNYATRRDLRWTDQQMLESGWLGSRTPTQFVTARSRRSDVALDIRPPADAGQSWTARNDLGVLVHAVLVHTADGEWLEASDIAAGATVPLSPAGDSRGRALTAAVNGQSLQRPPDFQGSHSGGAIFGLSGWRRWYGNERTASQRTSRLEEAMQSVRQGHVPPRGYIAWVESSPELTLGTSDAREEDSLHMVIGQW